MLADLDLLLIAVFCTADDLPPKRAENARRRITDAEVVTLCIAQAMLGIPSDERFLAVAAKRLPQAQAATGRDTGGVDRRVRAPQPRLLRRQRALDRGLQLVARCERQPGQMLILIGDKNLRGKEFEQDLAALDAKIMRPRRKEEPGKRPHLAPIRQRIESIFFTCKDILTLERHGARTLHNLRVRLSTRFAALAAAVALNHRLGRPSRSLACYTT